ncbi:MAG: class I SAM-dependent methyltransferase, partial [Calditrichaeota bacterium]|nr:class I SAM-dependent methyltransferase [Calditrichota bacterium]
MQKDNKSAPSKIGVWRMFDKIAKRYDFLNRLFSLRRDVAWRKKLVRFIPKRQGLNILDLATGTADVLLTIEKQVQNIHTAIGLDMATRMLEIGRRKVQAKGALSKISLLPGDALHIPLKANHFDVVTMAFGIRNVVKIERCLNEMNKVLKPDGRAL